MHILSLVTIFPGFLADQEYQSVDFMQLPYVTLDSPTSHLYYLFESDKFPLLNWLNMPVL